MSVSTEITRINNAKSAISAAITEKGVTVPSGTKIDGMATLIQSIPGADTYMPKSGGTFTGVVKAGSGGQSPGTYLLRNIKVSLTAEDPTVNGQICFLAE